MQEPAQSRSPTRTITAKKKGKVINNVTDLKTFLAKKKLERAQKLSENHPSEEQPSRGPWASEYFESSSTSKMMNLTLFIALFTF